MSRGYDESRVHSALSIEARSRIFDILLSEGPLDTEELSQRTGLMKTTIRHHLMILQDARLVEPVKIKKKRPGRPELSYRVLREYRELGVPKRQYLLLARELLDSIVTQKGQGSATATIRQIGKKVGKDLLRLIRSKRNKENGLAAFSTVLVPALEEMGSYPTLLKKSDDELVLKFSNCIFYELAIDFFPIVCEGHKSLFRTLAHGLGDYEAVQEKCAVEDGDFCITRIRKVARDRTE